MVFGSSEMFLNVEVNGSTSEVLKELVATLRCLEEHGTTFNGFRGP